MSTIKYKSIINKTTTYSTKHKYNQHHRKIKWNYGVCQCYINTSKKSLNVVCIVWRKKWKKKMTRGPNPPCLASTCGSSEVGYASWKYQLTPQKNCGLCRSTRCIRPILPSLLGRHPALTELKSILMAQWFWTVIMQPMEVWSEIST